MSKRVQSKPLPAAIWLPCCGDVDLDGEAGVGVVLELFAATRRDVADEVGRSAPRRGELILLLYQVSSWVVATKLCLISKFAKFSPTRTIFNDVTFFFQNI